MAEDGEPVVDQNYFKQVIAKAILWRRAEKLFDLLDLDGYRANSVAYAVAWMAEHTGRRIDLDKIWNEQRCSERLCEAIKVVCEKAHQHITQQDGNPGEASKRESCWQAFATLPINLLGDWESELADEPFVPANSVEESLATEWERIRHEFIGDSRTIGELESVTGKVWMKTRHGDPVYHYAEMDWPHLRKSRGMGLKRVKGLVEMFATAAKR